MTALKNGCIFMTIMISYGDTEEFKTDNSLNICER